ncbi:MAG: SRPBCC domain-containing protein [Actinomycetota bacterium]|nr:SRPBCC domain-containing protein [Actinomycetota bacterium]
MTADEQLIRRAVRVHAPPERAFSVGFSCDWGRVLIWEPPQRLAFTWQITPERLPQPDPAKASEVAVSFSPKGSGTDVSLEHRGFERHGEGSAEYRIGMDMPEGWTLLLERYRAAVAG